MSASAGGFTDNHTETVRIGELLLRVPGLSAQEGRTFSREVMQRVAQRLPDQGKVQSLGALDIKVRISEGTPRHRLVETVADAILRGLR